MATGVCFFCTDQIVSGITSRMPPKGTLFQGMVFDFAWFVTMWRTGQGENGNTRGERKSNYGETSKKPIRFFLQQHGEFRGLLRAWRINDKCPTGKEIPGLGILGDDYGRYHGDLPDKENSNGDNCGTLLRLDFCVTSGFQVPWPVL